MGEVVGLIASWWRTALLQDQTRAVDPECTAKASEEVAADRPDTDMDPDDMIDSKRLNAGGGSNLGHRVMVSRVVADEMPAPVENVPGLRNTGFVGLAVDLAAEEVSVAADCAMMQSVNQDVTTPRTVQ